MLSGLSNKWAMSSLVFRNVLWQMVKKVCVTSGLHLIENDKDTEAMGKNRGRFEYVSTVLFSRRQNSEVEYRKLGKVFSLIYSLKPDLSMEKLVRNEISLMS